MKADAFLKQAAIVVGERADDYGPASVLFERIAKRWSLTLGYPVTAAQVALCMIDLKLARLTDNPRHVDSALDVAGYAALLTEVTTCTK